MCPFQKIYNYLAEAVLFDYKHCLWMGATVPARMILNQIKSVFRQQNLPSGEKKRSISV
jgi:hypothetical protein